jgi:hypothetical protein
MTYGTSNAQYTFAVGRRFIENRAEDGPAPVGDWVNEVKAQHRELKSLNFDLDALCVNVLLNDFPSRFLLRTQWGMNRSRPARAALLHLCRLLSAPHRCAAARSSCGAVNTATARAC